MGDLWFRLATFVTGAALGWIAAKVDSAARDARRAAREAHETHEEVERMLDERDERGAVRWEALAVLLALGLVLYSVVSTVGTNSRLEASQNCTEQALRTTTRIANERSGFAGRVSEADRAWVVTLRDFLRDELSPPENRTEAVERDQVEQLFANVNTYLRLDRRYASSGQRYPERAYRACLVRETR